MQFDLEADADRTIAWVRLLAVPVVVLEVAIERGNYPPGDERWAWALAAALAAGAAVFALVPRRIGVPARARLGVAALAFDTGIVSAYVVLYSFEPGTPVRQLLLLPVVEAALRYGTRAGVVFPLASVPALALFEWRQAERLELHPFDPGHVVFPVGLQLLVGLIVGSLADRARRRARAD